jgi:hypothetical protein
MKSTVIVVIVTSVFAMGMGSKARAGENERCSNANLRGSFGYTSTGNLFPAYAPPPFAGPFAEIGRQTFDGRGNTEATATLSANGNIARVTIAGTYTVNPDCTGIMTLDVSPLGLRVNADFVIVRDGAEFQAIGTDAGVVETRVYKQQTRSGRR